MKAMLEIILKSTKIKLLLVCFMVVAIGAGFLLVVANDLLTVVLNDYLMVQNFFTFYGIVVFRLDMLAGVFTMVALPIYFLLTAGFGEKIATLNGEYLKYVSNLSTVTQEGFENITNVKAKGAHDFFCISFYCCASQN